MFVSGWGGGGGEGLSRPSCFNAKHYYILQFDCSLSDLDVHSRSQGCGKSWHLYSYSVVKLHEATHVFVMVDCVREMTANKSCKYGEYGSFEQLLIVLMTDLSEKNLLFVFTDVHRKRSMFQSYELTNIRQTERDYVFFYLMHPLFYLFQTNRSATPA